MQTIQLTAQVDDDGMLRVQMPEGLKNTTVDATIVFTATSCAVAWGDRAKSLFPSPEGMYGDREFDSLAIGLGTGEDWEKDYCPGTHLLWLFAVEGIYYWTVLPQTPQELAPIYSSSDEPDFATASPDYPSLTAFLEENISRLEFVWKIN